MRFNTLEFSTLPTNREEAFTEFVSTISEEYDQYVQNDRKQYSDQDGYYHGSYEPERSFVTSILAFLDEYEIESDIVDISELSNLDFQGQFGKFKSKVEYLTTRFQLRQQRIKSGGIGTLINIDSNYKIEIGGLLETIRKIVNQEVQDHQKKDRVFKIIANLQSEIDRDQTTIDALFGRMLELSQTIGEASDKIDPLLEKLERLKKLFWDNSKKVEQLPKLDRPKLIAKDAPSDAQNDMDDEIPF